MPDPDGGPAVVERNCVRLVVLDSLDRMLLFHARDIANPDLGMWWELPGGGIDPPETFLDGELIDEPFERWS